MIPHKSPQGIRAFSLVEVVLALGLCTFVIVGLVGLLSVGIQSGKDSEDQIQAANMASLLISTRSAAPTNYITNFGIPVTAMTNSYGNAFTAAVNYIANDGTLTNATYAAYQITCQAGTNSQTGSEAAQVYLMLSWPPQANVANGTARHYELLTYIPLQ
jgi:uncharacterized protein (TIGR02598 family)